MIKLEASGFVSRKLVQARMSNAAANIFSLVGLILIGVACCTLLLSRPLCAQSPGRLVGKGNGSYNKGDFDKAVEYYEKASVKAPESPIIAFNMGNAFFRKEDFSKAREYYEEAALETKDLTLEARAWYNLGNTAFREAERQLDSDLEKALEFYEEAVNYYETALEKNPELHDAAHNIEITRLIIKDLLDRIKKQQEAMKEQQEKLKEIVDSLLALAEREKKAIGESTDLSRSQQSKGIDWAKRLGGLEGDQAGISDGTREVKTRLDTLFAAQRPPQVDSAQAHLDTSLVNQVDALNDLAGQDPAAAAEEQEKALEQIQLAIEKLTEGENQQQQQQPEQGDQQQGQQEQQEPEPEDQQQQERRAPRNETARAILDEEKENKKKRRAQASRGYKAVDKDW
jgi:tetratricopeptide (TPR) repeat protein